MPYDGDSFFTLSVLGRIGVLVLAAAMAGGLLALVRRLARGRAAWVRAGIGMAAGYAFVWLSPQVFYEFYKTQFDDLPAQWVIAPPGLGDMLARMTFTGTADLSTHGAGALIWVLLAAALLRR